MFSSLLRPKQRKKRVEDDRLPASPSSGPIFKKPFPVRHAIADFTEADDDDEDESHVGNLRQRPGEAEDDDEEEEEEEEDDDDDGDGDEDGDDGSGPRKGLPVVPLFSASHLDALSIYNITHAIRVVIQTRTETTLTWEQLRSPQVSQFLVKPMQQQIRSQHFSRATLYCLMANCLQFQKEGQLFPGNAGVSATRARVCELLALKLLKEYNTRELIDALSYDFYPLQGIPGSPQQAMKTMPGIADAKTNKGALTASRTSTLEVAIRATAKHFLAHPLVVQQLEAIWNGAITFYSAADTLHRGPPSTPVSSANGQPTDRTPLLGGASHRKGDLGAPPPPGRRTVILYDPRHASLFKLSRLRVPRYRFFLSTLSLLFLIGLFLAVLSQRSTKITSLELIFWFWSAGFMLDELVGFNEQGFSLYIMSFWNIFDLGILCLLIVYYIMRVYCVFLIDPSHWNDLAYDVLAANAILLLPRIFSVLDHYQYFSQLLIAFRLMAVDLAAVLVLVLVACSGFFVFFTLANNRSDASDVAYRIFQILMGFTPAAWDGWPVYSLLEKISMGLFLIICHFVVVTILITVLTNSFMKIASNATEEHQFLFALNTISMVKNDALFSYVAPGNIFAWLLMPLRYCMPLRHFVLLNRSIIKVTHFPLLFCIYLYERYWLASSIFEPTDLVENPHRSRGGRALSFADPASRTALFSPNVRVREESVVGYQKDHALEEVFRRGPGLTTLRNHRRHERRKTQNAIRNWMEQHDDDPECPPNQPEWPSVNGKPRPEWQRRFSMNKEFRGNRPRQFSDIRSAASDPADLMSQSNAHMGSFSRHGNITATKPDIKDQTDADGDDELVTNDEDEDEEATNAGDTARRPRRSSTKQVEDYFTTTQATRFAPPAPSSQTSTEGAPNASPRQNAPPRRAMHNRTLSTNTILYAPEESLHEGRESNHQSASPRSPVARTPNRPKIMATRTTVVEPAAQATGKRSPRRQMYVTTTKPRPIMPPRDMAHTAPNRAGLHPVEQARLRPAGVRRLSSIDLSAMSDNTNLMAVEDPNAVVPSSFQTQMAMALMKNGGLGGRGNDAADRDRMSRLVLARMKTLEESFADVARELRELKTNSNSTAPPTRGNSSGSDEIHGKKARPQSATIEIAGRERKKGIVIEDAHHSQYQSQSQSQSRPRLIKRPSAKRPASRRSMKESKVGMAQHKKAVKGKEVAHSSDSDDEKGGIINNDEDYTKKGSSF